MNSGFLSLLTDLGFRVVPEPAGPDPHFSQEIVPTHQSYTEQQHSG